MKFLMVLKFMNLKD